jgi:hypothetical protein
MTSAKDGDPGSDILEMTPESSYLPISREQACRMTDSN